MGKMNFEEFVDTAAEKIKDFLPAEYKDAEIEITTVRKIGSEYTGMTVKKPESHVAVAINLDQKFNEYANGNSLGKVLTEMADEAKTPIPFVSLEGYIDYESVKKDLFVRVCDSGFNEKILENVPHKDIDGISITYHIRMEETNGALASTMINNQVLQALGINEETLHRDALENGQRIFPAIIENLEDRVIANPESLVEGRPKMLVVTNGKMINGAAAMFYDGVQEECSRKLGGDFFVIPSSTNEMLAIKDTGKEDYQAMERLLMRMNVIITQESDVLSYKVYHYDSDAKIFEKAENYEDRKIGELFDRHLEQLLKKIEDDHKIDHETDRKTDHEFEKSEIRNHSFSLKM